MRAVDTNVLARLILNDDREQALLAKTLFQQHHIYVTVTVLLELEWVLRSGHRFARAQIVSTLHTLRGQPNVTIEDDDKVALALLLADGGADFADALHLVRCGECTDFVTFDQALAATAADTVTLLTA